MTYSAAKFQPASHETAEERRQRKLIGCTRATQPRFLYSSAFSMRVYPSEAAVPIYLRGSIESSIRIPPPFKGSAASFEILQRLPSQRHTYTRIHHVALLKLNTRRAQARNGTRDRTASPAAPSNRSSPAYRTITIQLTTAHTFAIDPSTARPRLLRRTPPSHTTCLRNAFEHTERTYVRRTRVRPHPPAQHVLPRRVRQRLLLLLVGRALQRPVPVRPTTQL